MHFLDEHQLVDRVEYNGKSPSKTVIRIDHVGNVTVKSESLTVSRDRGFFTFVLYSRAGSDLEMTVNDLKQRIPELKE